MKIFAIPTVNRLLTPHFGHCEEFAIIRVDADQIIQATYLNPPRHEPGSFPAFLAEHGVQVIISGGMGRKAIDLFSRYQIEVCTGAESLPPEMLVEQYLQKQLTTGHNLCDH
jgi:predicted Fe-Mo cluster-binding NifX family protein